MNGFKVMIGCAALLATSCFHVQAKLVSTPKPAEGADSIAPGMLLMPLVFECHKIMPPALQVPRLSCGAGHRLALRQDTSWLVAAQDKRRHVERVRYETIVRHPDLVPYNVKALPEPPKEYVITPNPAQSRLDIATTEGPVADPLPVVESRVIKMRNWLHTLKASLHFTQAYVSENWYQGGENNMNVLTDIQWDVNLNPKTHPNYLFKNRLHYKLGMMTAHSDTLRNYTVNEDNLQFTSTFGYKAVKNWYYSATLLFKTQFFNNYKPNTNTMSAAFLSPGELNVGLGMTYSYKDKEEIKELSLSFAPLSYNLKMCRDIKDLDPVSFGMKPGHHTKSSFGSNFEGKATWKIHPNVVWTTRLYAFTNYEYMQGDWESTFDFTITRHLNAQVYTHLRYDKSRPWDADWRYWQFKEILSLGLTYRFATN